MVQARPSPRGERTRRSILEAAEGLFAERGFADSRLEDVAEAVGIRRASIVYYFRDKRELYEAVLEDVFTGLLARVEAALRGSAPLARRIPAAAGAWVDYVGERPSLARLLLREVADAGRDDPPVLLEQVKPFQALAERILAESAGDPTIRRARLDPVHVASLIAGGTVFFVAALPALAPGFGFDPARREALAGHREEVVRTVHRLLGIPGPTVDGRRNP